MRSISSSSVNKRLSLRQFFLSFRPTVVSATLMSVGLAVALTPQFAFAQAIGDVLPTVKRSDFVCGGNFTGAAFGCSSQDISVAQTTVESGATSCLAGDDIIITVNLVLEQNGQTRYDPLVWIGESGNDPRVAVTLDANNLPTGDSCFVSTLPGYNNGANLGFVNGEVNGDVCNDSINAGVQITQEIGPIALRCSDADTDGQLDVSGLITWQNNSDQSNCGDPGVDPLTPDPITGFILEPNANNPKCAFGSTNLDVEVRNAQLTIRKVYAPGGQTFNFGLSTPLTPKGDPVAISSFDLTPPGTVEEIFTIIAPVGGTPVVITEGAPPAGIGLESAVCDSGKGAPNDQDGITLLPGDDVICTFTNIDMPSLSLVKTVTNDDGGGAVYTDWTLSAAGPTPLSGAGGVAATSVLAGTYILSESAGPTGYAAGDWSCTAGTLTGDSLVLAQGDEAECTINNNDVPPQLTLVKNVTNDNNGDALATEFNLTVGGTPVDTGVSNVYVAGTPYAINETLLPGYEFTIITGDPKCPTALGGTITLAVGDDITCTITNNDIAPTLTLIKDPTNDSGGDAAPDSFLLTVGGGAVLSGASNEYAANTPLAINETQLEGYTFVSITGDDKCPTTLGGTITLDEGDDITCTITNDDVAPQLTLIKDPTNDNGGNAAPDDFLLTVGGVGVTSGDSNEYAANTPLAINETQLTGYTFVSITGDDKCPAALGGGITLAPGDDITCTITNDDVAPQLTLIKDPTNDNGGNAAPDDFLLTVDGGAVLSGASNEYAANTPLAIDETQLDGYTFVSITGDPKCPASLGGTVTLAPGDDITCTVTNDDVAPTLTLVKDVTNDDGGDAVPSSFQLRLDGGTYTNAPFFSDDTPGVEANTAYTVSEDPLTGYTETGIVCLDDADQANLGNPVTLNPGQSATCTVSNDDDPPQITVVKSVINDDGGSSVESDFTLHLTGDDGEEGTCGQDGLADLTSGDTPTPVEANCSYTLSEDPVNGYNVVDIECTDDSTQVVVGHPVTLTEGQFVTCIITNDDTPPGLTLLKSVTNDDGGTALPVDFTLRLSGGAYDGTEVFRSGDNPAVASNVEYTLSEDALTGYTETGIACVDNSDQSSVPHPVTLGEGDSVSCTISNDDDQPLLTLLKEVINDDGGLALRTDWTLTATGSPTISGVDGDLGITAAEVNAGVFTLSESAGPEGYAPSAWECLGMTNSELNGSILTIALGEDVTCTITNDDVASGLTLVKDVTNDDGGDALAADFTLRLTGGVYTGAAFVSGDQPEVVANTAYTLSEDALAGYTETGIACVDNEDQSPVAHPVSLSEGQSVTCTISNDDDAPSLTLVKDVTNDDGGDALAADFTLRLTGGVYTGTEVFATGATPAVLANTSYTLSEDALAGYTETGIACVDDADQSAVAHPVSLSEGQSVTCTISNDDEATSLTLLKDVTNDNGGRSLAGDFVLRLVGGNFSSTDTHRSGVTLEAESNTVYTLSEDAVAGYTEVGIACVDDADQSSVPHPLTMNEGQAVTCTISNDDNAPGLTLVKNVTNDDGGTVMAADFVLRLTGGTYTGAEAFATGATPVVLANTSYTLGEDAVMGYQQTGVACVDNSDQSIVAHPVSLNTGQSVTCTISNDDIQPLLTLVKVVVNEDGGQALPTDWTLTANGDPTISGVTGDPSITNAGVTAGDFILTESGPDGYLLTSLACVNNATPLAGNVLSIGVGESVTCVFTNDDQTGEIRVLVETIPSGAPDLFDFTLSGGTVPNVSLQRAIDNPGIEAPPVYQQFSLADGDAPYSSGALLPSSINGDYSVQEAGSHVGWILVSATCDNSDNPAAITLAADAVVICTFVYEREYDLPDPALVPVNANWALLMLILMMLATGWYFRPATMHRF